MPRLAGVRATPQQTGQQALGPSNPRRCDRAPAGVISDRTGLLHLQGTIGMRAVGALLGAGFGPPQRGSNHHDDACEAPGLDRARGSRKGSESSARWVRLNAPILRQAKLQVASAE